MIQPVEAVLRCEGRHRVGGADVPWAQLAVMVCTGGFAYGLVMGSYSGRSLQALYSGIKVPMLLGVSSVICLPSFYVINSLLGLRRDFTAAFRGIVAAQATLALCLAALAPVTAVIYLSIDNYPLATMFNGIQFALATIGGQSTLTQHYRPLIRTNPRHLVGKWAWAFVYVFVAIQMAWVLRPFIGAPDLPPAFFREDAWSNAYVVVTRTVLDVFGLR